MSRQLGYLFWNSQRLYLSAFNQTNDFCRAEITAGSVTYYYKLDKGLIWLKKKKI